LKERGIHAETETAKQSALMIVKDITIL